MCRRRRFLTAAAFRGFTSIRRSQFQLLGHLRPFVFETHVRFVLLFVRPFALLNASGCSGICSLPASAPLLRPLLTSRAALLSRYEASRSFARSPRSASPRIRFLYIGPRFRSPLPSHARSPLRSWFASIRMTSSRRDLHPQDNAHAGRTRNDNGHSEAAAVVVNSRERGSAGAASPGMT